VDYLLGTDDEQFKMAYATVIGGLIAESFFH
jgi:hypothetical protein